MPCASRSFPRVRSGAGQEPPARPDFWQSLAAVLLAIIDLAGLLPWVFTRALEAAQTPLGVLVRERSAAAGARLLPQLSFHRRPGLGLVAGRNRVGVLLFVV